MVNNTRFMYINLRPINFHIKQNVLFVLTPCPYLFIYFIYFYKLHGLSPF